MYIVRFGPQAHVLLITPKNPRPWLCRRFEPS